MNTKNKDELSKLFEFLDAKDEPQSYDVDEVISNAGFSINDVGEKFQAIAKKYSTKTSVDWREQSHQDYENALLQYQRKQKEERPKRTHLELVTAIKTLISTNNFQAKFAYRNFEELNDEDLDILLKQLEFAVSSKKENPD